MKSLRPLVLIFLISYLGHSQKAKVQSVVNNDYNSFAYVKTSDILLKVAENGYKSPELFEKLANSFYFNNKMEDATKWYSELINLKGDDVDSEVYFRYAQALKYIEKYEEADRWMQKFYDSNIYDSRGKAFISNVDYLSDIEQNVNKDLVLHNLNINTALSDFGTVQINNSIVFASTRGDGRIYKWNEQPYLDLYSAVKQNDSTYVQVKNFDSEINTKFHESTVTFTKDGKRVYFTRNNYYQNKYRKDDQNINRLKIFRATVKNDGSWGDIESLHFNSDNYSVAHPVFNAKGTKLYFASDMPGSIGESDIYVANVNKDGSVGNPINLGPSINTEGKETFPFINDKGDLFFATNGYPGLGGLDIHVIRDFENKFQNRSNDFEIKNIGPPINSPQDDFCYYENTQTKEGFITSNRPNGKGDDDIYSFKIYSCEQVVEGVVVDKISLELLPQAKVTLYNKFGELVNEMVVGNDAYFKFDVECNAEYLVRAEKEKYIPDEKRFTTPVKQQKLELEFTLTRNEHNLKPGDDLAKVLDIPIIYFDFDKYNIRYDAQVELQKVFEVMKQYPTMVVDIRSHTDCRGSYKYNEALSENRAKSTRRYLIKMGIAPDRLTAKGYGEYRLVNDCGCEGNVTVECSEEDHQLNRRSEFIIMKM
ncbi:OmpA family protein [Aestuariibaculum sediminum]|uniref:OmpA family protein n=1 Tax=Aestuariibaculum sediminum TaxID=2770637 RepID=A0A8J6Q699_9FLAO|nr:OmpA family protein [Aestuariibaculum sediminum]MBD0830510.1 OmpA family protein [Aestuariibaculum sediminum]